jgi:hypothetical protein
MRRIAGRREQLTAYEESVAKFVEPLPRRGDFPHCILEDYFTEGQRYIAAFICADFVPGIWEFHRRPLLVVGKSSGGPATFIRSILDTLGIRYCESYPGKDFQGVDGNERVLLLPGFNFRGWDRGSLRKPMVGSPAFTAGKGLFPHRPQLLRSTIFIGHCAADDQEWTTLR